MSNQIVTEHSFEEILSFFDKYAAIKQNGKWGYIDRQGQIVLQPRYDWVETTNFGPDKYITVMLDGKYGVLNDKFEEIIAPQYDEIGNFLYGIASVRCGDKWGAIDTNGKLIAPAIYARTQPAPEGSVFVATELKEDILLWGMADNSGNLVIPATNKAIKHFHNGLVWSKRVDDKHTLYKQNGEIVIDGWERWKDPIAGDYCAIALTESGITKQVCSIYKDWKNGGLALNIKGEFNNWHLSPQGWLWVEDQDSHITVYNNKGEIAAEFNDLKIAATTNRLIRGEFVRYVENSVIACENKAGHLLIFNETAEEVFSIQKKVKFEEMFLAKNNHVILKGKSSSAIISLTHKKLIKVKNIAKTYVFSEDVFGFVGGYIHSWTDDVDYCEDKQCYALAGDHFILCGVQSSDKQTLLTATGKLLLQDVSNNIVIHKEYCVVDYDDHCDIYTPNGDFVSVANCRSYDNPTSIGRDIVPLKNADNHIQFVSLNGEHLYTLPDKIDQIAALRGNVIPIHNKDNQMWKLMDTRGSIVSDIEYCSILGRNERDISKRTFDQSYIHITFSYLDFESNIKARKILYREKGSTIIDDDGKELIPLFNGVIFYDFNRSNYYKLNSAVENKWQWIKVSGKEVVYSEKYDNIIFEVMERDGLQGVIDVNTLEVLLPPIFKSASALIRQETGVIKELTASIDDRYYRFDPNISLINKTSTDGDLMEILKMEYY